MIICQLMWACKGPWMSLCVVLLNLVLKPQQRSSLEVQNSHRSTADQLKYMAPEIQIS